MGDVYEHAEPYDPQPPEEEGPRTVPVCPLCGGMMRRRTFYPHPLYCDIHGIVEARWETEGDDEG